MAGRDWSIDILRELRFFRGRGGGRSVGSFEGVGGKGVGQGSQGGRGKGWGRDHRMGGEGGGAGM